MSDMVGVLASALVLATFSMRSMLCLRVVAIASNLAFIAYALLLELLPILLLHSILLPINTWHAAAAWQRVAHDPASR